MSKQQSVGQDVVLLTNLLQKYGLRNKGPKSILHSSCCNIQMTSVEMVFCLFHIVITRTSMFGEGDTILGGHQKHHVSFHATKVLAPHILERTLHCLSSLLSLIETQS